MALAGDEGKSYIRLTPGSQQAGIVARIVAAFPVEEFNVFITSVIMMGVTFFLLLC